MKRELGILGALVLAALVLWMVSRPGEDGGSPAVPPPVPSRRVPPEDRDPGPPVPPPAVPPGPAKEEEPAAAPEATLEITGRVTFPDGNPVPGISVQSEESRIAANTDEGGFYRLTGLREGPVGLWLVHTQQRRTADAGSGGADFVVKGHVVRVRVVDEQGKPVEEGHLSYTGTRDGQEVMSGTGIYDGGIDLTVARSGTVIRYSASAEGLDQATAEVVLEGEPRVHDRTIVLPRPRDRGSMALAVTDEFGQPLKAAYVTLRDGAGKLLGQFYERKVDLDGGGRAVIEDLQPGTFRLQVKGTKGAWDTASFGGEVEREVRIEAGKAFPVEVQLPAGGWVRVTVKDREGKVLVAAFVRLMDEEGGFVDAAFYGQDGDTWSWPPRKPGPVVLDHPVPPGRYTVEAVKGEGEEAKVVLGSASIQVAAREILDVEIRFEK